MTNAEQPQSAAQGAPPTTKKKRKQHTRPPSTLPVLLRFTDLVEKGIATSWMQVNRLIDQQGFPTGTLLSANTRAWPAAEVEAWLATRPTGKKPVPGRRTSGQAA
jgi:predicted DNA-binding transcriptional regulator AlpA